MANFLGFYQNRYSDISYIPTNYALRGRGVLCYNCTSYYNEVSDLNIGMNQIFKPINILQRKESRKWLKEYFPKLKL